MPHPFAVFCERVGTTDLSLNGIRDTNIRASHTARSKGDVSSIPVPLGLRRHYGGQDLHFITCSCYRRRPWLGTPARRTLFLNILEQARVAYGFTVIGYVVMPEHIHLLLSEPNEGDLSRVMQVLKQRLARRVLTSARRRKCASQTSLWDGNVEHFWQRRFYDFNVERQ